MGDDADKKRQLPCPSHGMAVWSSPEWRDEAVAWLDDRLAAAGIERRGDVEQPHLRPWATALRAPTSNGAVWLKAPGPGTAYEIGLYQLVARVVPDWVLIPIAVDLERGWIVLPDGGPSLGEQLAGSDLGAALAGALVHYGRLQIELVPHADELVALGVPDMRPARMLDRFDEALEVTGATIGSEGGADSAAATMHRKVSAMRTTFGSWCEELQASRVAPSLDHNDLHPWNILGGPDDTKFYDWGDAVVAHPFAAMLVPLGRLVAYLGVALDDPQFLHARDAYLDVFTDVAPREDLAATLATACRVAKAARVLTWERGLRTARQLGDPMDDRWAAASVETLASLLDESYLGGF